MFYLLLNLEQKNSYVWGEEELQPLQLWLSVSCNTKLLSFKQLLWSLERQYGQLVLFIYIYISLSVLLNVLSIQKSPVLGDLHL